VASEATTPQGFYRELQRERRENSQEDAARLRAMVAKREADARAVQQHLSRATAVRNPDSGIVHVVRSRYASGYTLFWCGLADHWAGLLAFTPFRHLADALAVPESRLCSKCDRHRRAH